VTGWRIKQERFVHYVGPGVPNAVYLRGFYQREAGREMALRRIAEVREQRRRRLGP